LVTKSKNSEQGVNPNPNIGIPPIPSGIQDHSFHAQAIFDINKQVARLETGLESVDKRLVKVETKLDQVQIDIACLKTTATHIEALMKTSVKALSAIAGSLCVFGLGLLTIWLKHKMNW
jgi:hypothetical protein